MIAVRIDELLHFALDRGLVRFGGERDLCGGIFGLSSERDACDDVREFVRRTLDLQSVDDREGVQTHRDVVRALSNTCTVGSRAVDGQVFDGADQVRDARGFSARCGGQDEFEIGR